MQKRIKKLIKTDTEVYEGTLKQMVDFMKKNYAYGIGGCQLIGVDDAVQPSVRKFPTPASHLMIFLKLHYLFPKCKILKHYFQYDFNYTR
ncbi:unnamed protein product, partial [marine sediment metagenome]